MRGGYLPACNCDSRVGCGIGPVLGKSGIANARALLDGLGQLPNSDIVANGALIVGGINSDGGNTNLCATGSPCLLYTVSLGYFPSRERWTRSSSGATHQTSSADLDRGSLRVHGAVRSSEHGVGIEQYTSAEVGAALRQADNEWKVAGLGLLTADNECAHVAIAGGWEGCGEGRESQSSGECKLRSHDV
jgi:hypothetical protein